MANAVRTLMLVALIAPHAWCKDEPTCTSCGDAEPVPMVMIADPGVDDAASMLLALASSRAIELLGVHTSFGCHSDVDVVHENALRVLDAAGRLGDVVVHRGAAMPLGAVEGLGDGDGRIVHGPLALGGPEVARAPLPPLESRAPQPNVSAAENLVALARARPGEVIVAIASAPTELALALALEPALPALLRGVYAMGGAIAHFGNISPVAEANFAFDAAAARIVVAAFGAKLVLFPLDVTHQALFSRADADELRARGGAAAAWFADIHRHYRERYAEVAGITAGSPLHDAHVIAAALDASLYTYARKRLSVVVASPGDPTNGATIFDRRLVPQSRPAVGEATVTVAVSVDAARFKELFIERVASLP